MRAGAAGLAGAIALLAFLGWSGASFADESWQLRNVTGHLPDLRFSLTDDSGLPVTAGNYRGEVTLLYFGFTGCAAECPATMARLTDIVQKLGKYAASVRILFVTINPENDTPAVLHRYLTAFDPRHMVGLTGNTKEIAALAKRCRAAYRPGGISADMPHSNLIYIFDTAGHVRLLATPEDAETTIVTDIRRLLHAG